VAPKACVAARPSTFAAVGGQSGALTAWKSARATFATACALTTGSQLANWSGAATAGRAGGEQTEGAAWSHSESEGMAGKRALGPDALFQYSLTGSLR